MAGSRRDGLASTLGMLVFLGGIGLIVAMFWQAWDIFSKAPRLNLGILPGKPIDIGIVLMNLSRLVVRVLLLVVMAGIGSVLANRGVKLYASGHAPDTVPTKPSESDG